MKSKLRAVSQTQLKENAKTLPFSFALSLITLGVVYGDIGTSPMYTIKAIVNGNGGFTSVSEDLVLGALSLMIWTMTLITTLKYVFIALRADNKQEGGIFALYSLVKHCAPWLVIPAMIGGAALLSDGILTPAVTVTSAVEGLRSIELGQSLLGDDQMRVVLITLIILSLLFLVQRAGTSMVGKAFGPLMVIWFGFLLLSGAAHVLGNLSILRAINPLYGIEFLFSPVNKAGLMVLGFVFLCTTGAEALYSDMGHVGRKNILATWPFVKLSLIVNYLGQGAWVLSQSNNIDLLSKADLNPFYEMLPESMRAFSIALSTIAALIASQALITGSYSLVSEATRLNLLPHMQISYPSQTKGQLYIPMVNTLMWASCCLVVLYFQSSSNMEAAYGLAITITMLMTSILLFAFLHNVLKLRVLSWPFLIFFGALESCFFFSSLTKFFHGGFVTVFIALLIFSVMYVWIRGSAIERSQSVFLPIKDYLKQLSQLRYDKSIGLLADNLVFLTNDPQTERLDRDILYSILDKRPKRARSYWFVHVKVSDEPYTSTYSVQNFGTDYVFKVQLHLGFKVAQRINVYLRQIVQDLVRTGELKPNPQRYSIYKNPEQVGDFKFCLIRKALCPETSLRPWDSRILQIKYALRRACGNSARWYGLESSSIIYEYVPLFSREKAQLTLKRVGIKQSADAKAGTARSVQIRDSYLEDMQTALEVGRELHFKEGPKQPEKSHDLFVSKLSQSISESVEDVSRNVIGGEEADFRALYDDNDDEDFAGEETDKEPDSKKLDKKSYK